MIETERHLAALCCTLIGKNARLSKAERILVPRHSSISTRTLTSIRKQIRAGLDPLGDIFCTIRSAEARRGQGATYTPLSIVDAMLAWATQEEVEPVRIVDPGAGTGRFILAAAKRFPRAQLVAVEIDPLAALMLRANAAVLKVGNRLTVELSDYRTLKLPQVDGPTLFIGNPPYVRHHDIEPQWKAWLGDAAHQLGFTASGLAGLHIHFFVRTRQIARPGDFGAFITAAEWMDVNYGSVLRHMLADGLGGTALHVIDPKARPFADAMTTGAITCFRVGNRPSQLTVRTVDSLDKLAPLTDGRAIEWNEVQALPRWSVLIRQGRERRSGEIEVGELFRVHRGQVTGCNAAWIAGPEAANLPARFLFPAITKARDLLSAGASLDDAAVLKRVIDLPVDLDELTAEERRAVERFLKWAKTLEADKSFVAKQRRAWWAVQLRAPAPILCTYMARRAPAFVRNHAGARHLNIAHGLYPLQPMSEATLDALAQHLMTTVSTSGGRTYAGGLVKFEPGEISRLHIPEPSTIGLAT
jgi:SAM-dependent methyltransferase|tara:strand:+ start:1547 stop:3133 length:1587 start_codon:yes stop_codon:yes gene_type:complete